MEGLQLNSMIQEWWSREENPRLQQTYNAIPTLILGDMEKKE